MKIFQNALLGAVTLFSGWLFPQAELLAVDARPIVTFLDMGQGESTLIHCPNTNVFILVDFGSRAKTGFVVPEAVDAIRNRMRADTLNQLPLGPDTNGNLSLFRLYFTHGDADHINQIHRLMDRHVYPLNVRYGGFREQYTAKVDGEKVPDYIDEQSLTNPIAPIATNFYAAVPAPALVPLPPAPADYTCPVHPNEPGVSLHILQVNPVIPGLNTRGDQRNAVSLVMRLDITGLNTTDRRMSVLLTGDATSHAEDRLINDRPNLFASASDANVPPIRLLKVAHHGSTHSSTANFLALADPTAAVVSGAAAFNWRHPDCAVYRRILAVGHLDQAAANFQKLCKDSVNGFEPTNDTNLFLTTRVMPFPADLAHHYGATYDIFFNNTVGAFSARINNHIEP